MSLQSYNPGTTTTTTTQHGQIESLPPHTQMQKIKRISAEYHETINLLNENIDELYKRKERTGDLEKKSENLRDKASAEQAYHDIVRKYVKWGIIMVLLIAIATAAIAGGLIGFHVIQV